MTVKIYIKYVCPREKLIMEETPFQHANLYSGNLLELKQRGWMCRGPQPSPHSVLELPPLSSFVCPDPGLGPGLQSRPLPAPSRSSAHAFFCSHESVAALHRHIKSLLGRVQIFFLKFKFWLYYFDIQSLKLSLDFMLRKVTSVKRRHKHSALLYSISSGLIFHT